MDGRGEKVRELRFPGGTLEQGLAVVEVLCQWKNGGRFAVEAIGMNRWLVNAMHERGLDMIAVDAVKLNLRMLGKKTDRRDAYEIARRLWLGDIGRNAKTYLPSKEEYGCRRLLRTRHNLVQIRQQLVNQVRGLLNAYRVAAPTDALSAAGAGPRLWTIDAAQTNLGVPTCEALAWIASRSPPAPSLCSASAPAEGSRARSTRAPS